MKRYFFVDREDQESKKCDRIARIYKLNRKTGTLDFIAFVAYRIGCGSKGTVAEVFNKLIECGEIPKKWYNSSENEWRGAGYYGGPVMKYYSIEELY